MNYRRMKLKQILARWYGFISQRFIKMNKLTYCIWCALGRSGEKETTIGRLEVVGCSRVFNGNPLGLFEIIQTDLITKLIEILKTISFYKKKKYYSQKKKSPYTHTVRGKQIYLTPRLKHATCDNILFVFN